MINFRVGTEIEKHLETIKKKHDTLHICKKFHHEYYKVSWKSLL